LFTIAELERGGFCPLFVFETAVQEEIEIIKSALQVRL
jgi:hypothetical protein